MIEIIGNAPDSLSKLMVVFGFGFCIGSVLTFGLYELFLLKKPKKRRGDG